MNISPETIAKRTEDLLSFVQTYGLKLIFAIVVFWIGLKIIGYIGIIIDKALSRAHIDTSLKKFLESLLSGLLKIVLVVIVLSVFGVKASSFLAIFGAAGLAVGLALQGSLANFASGIMILFFKPYKIGNFIKANDQSGTVQSIAVFNTTLLSPEGRTITIPNSLITGGNIINYSNNDNVRVDVQVGISYDADLHKAKKVLQKILTDHDFVLSDPASGVFVSELGDSSVNLIVRGYVKPGQYRPTFFDITEQCKIALDEHNIEIPYPHQVVHRHDKSPKKPSKKKA